MSLLISLILIVYLLYTSKVLIKDKKSQGALNTHLSPAAANNKLVATKIVSDSESKDEDVLHRNNELVSAAVSVTNTMQFHSPVHNSIYNFLADSDNRKKVFSAAVSLNAGSSDNTCVYFVSEVLRKIGLKVPRYIANTSQLISKLQNDGWKKNRDYTELMPGDICFTTDEWLNKNGVPTHAYIFMGWVTEGNYDYAYVCDNQPKDYGGNIYHKRNITKKVKENGKTKEPFSFFMHK